MLTIQGFLFVYGAHATPKVFLWTNDGSLCHIDPDMVTMAGFLLLLDFFVAVNELDFSNQSIVSS